MYKAAVIGDRQRILGFRALGLEVAFAQNAQEAAQAIGRSPTTGMPMPLRST
jgi:vacuolar-type H+-ATPase subunit F/Vma7